LPTSTTALLRPVSGPAIRLGGALLVCSLASCASYTERTGEALHAFERGRFEESRQMFADHDVTKSQFLSGAEAGTAAMAAGEWELAVQHLGAAAEVTAEFEERGALNPEDLGQDLGTWLVNESVASYKGEGFERVYLHSTMALAYLALGRFDDVWVENRLADRLLAHEEELYDRSYGAGGLGHFVSAVAYEIFGEPDQAYIDYRRMHEKGVGTRLAGRALVRLAAQLGYAEDLARWEREYGADYRRPEDAASIVVIGGLGLGPYKEESSITLPTGDGLLRFAVPVYRSRGQGLAGLRLVLRDSGQTVLTEELEDVDTVAAENLDDRIGWLAAKTIARGIAKQQLTKELGEQHGVAGWLAGNLIQLATERADLRHWSTLPASWAGARMFVSPGRHTLELHAVGGERVELGTWELDPGETMILLARSVGPRLHVHPVGGLRVDEAAPEPAGESAGPPAPAEHTFTPVPPGTPATPAAPRRTLVAARTHLHPEPLR
jgi:hypothetical protein